MTNPRLRCLESQVQAIWLSAERLSEVERDTQTLLLFDTGVRSSSLVLIINCYVILHISFTYI